MKITRITLWAKTLPLKKPYRLSGGRLRFEALDSTFVRIETDDGRVGWGEGAPWGHTYLPAHGAGIRAAAELLAPALLGVDPCGLDRVNAAMDVTLPGHLYAKAPFDIACWDLLGQKAGLALVDLLGGRCEEATPIASSISTGAPADMLSEIESYRARGYRVHSVKLGADIAEDVARIRFLEARRGPDERILYDVNRAWTRAEALAVMTAVADLPVAFEQPCETLDDCLAVRRASRQPISIDERLETLGDMARIAAEGIGEIVNIKIGRVGGLTRARRIRDLALEAGMQIYVMPTGGTVLADTDAAHFAQTIPIERRLGGWLCQEMLRDDPAPGRGARNGAGGAAGSVAAPTAPGLGVAPDLDWLGAPAAEFSAG